MAGQCFCSAPFHDPSPLQTAHTTVLTLRGCFVQIRLNAHNNPRHTQTQRHAHACHWWFCCGSSACSLVLNQRLRSSYQQQGADWIGLDWIGLDCALQAPKNTSKPKTTQNQTKNETANDFSLSSFSLFLLVAKNCILFLRFLPPSLLLLLPSSSATG